MKSFENEANQIMTSNQIPGAALGLNKNGEVLYFKGFGYRDVKKELEVTLHTVFGIASMTKSFTCVAIMQLQEAGKLSVHDQVIDHLPNFQMPNNEHTEDVTIHHLMTHTSGLPPSSTHIYARKESIEEDPSAIDYGLDLTDHQGESIYTYDELLTHISNLELKPLSAPGESFSYSNDCYGVLGALITKVSEMPYERYVTEKILQPAQMSNSFFDLEELMNRDEVAMLYAKKKSASGATVYEAPVWWDAPSMRATGYLKSTAHDLLRFLEIFRTKGTVENERVLTEASVEQMIFPHVEFEPGKFYGYGLRIIPDHNGSTLIEHGGGLKGVSSSMSVIPDQGLTGVVLSNLDSVPIDRLLKGAFNTIQNKEFSYSPFQFQDYDIMEAELTRFVGTYKSDEGMNVTFDVKDGHLRLHSGNTSEKLRCIGKNSFLTKSKQVISFPIAASGEVDRVRYSSRQIYKENLGGI